MPHSLHIRITAAVRMVPSFLQQGQWFPIPVRNRSDRRKTMVTPMTTPKGTPKMTLYINGQ